VANSNFGVLPKVLHEFGGVTGQLRERCAFQTLQLLVPGERERVSVRRTRPAKGKDLHTEHSVNGQVFLPSGANFQFQSLARFDEVGVLITAVKCPQAPCLPVVGSVADPS
jgi:hypothetical protein